MKIGSLDLYAPHKTALKKAGFKVGKVEKQGKRTVITVIRCGEIDEKPVFSSSNPNDYYRWCYEND
jgi:hypothetical protein